MYGASPDRIATYWYRLMAGIDIYLEDGPWKPQCLGVDWPDVA
jgi:hypothetical protein